MVFLLQLEKTISIIIRLKIQIIKNDESASSFASVFTGYCSKREFYLILVHDN